MLGAVACISPVDKAVAQAEHEFPVPAIPCQPAVYQCMQTGDPVEVDGRPDEAAWEAASWTDDFIDIQGPELPVPRFRTRVKMLWDDEFFYIAAEMEEPHLWATYDRRDMVIYHENEFEVFIDPDGDTHEYYELEINALNTVWDLLLLKPYRDGGPAVNGWDIAGLQTAVHLDGTLNDPSDYDTGWTVEIALPWAALAECAHNPAPPEAGDAWRVNFSRVQWRLDDVNGSYEKQVEHSTGQPFPEDNWVWSPQGLIAMHYPEMWGVVVFVEESSETTIEAWEVLPTTCRPLRRVYYAQKWYFKDTGHYASALDSLLRYPEFQDLQGQPVEIRTTFSGYEAVLRLREESGSIDQAGQFRLE